MKRIVSGIQSSGDPTLGNYLGAIKRWVEQQPREGGAMAGEEQFYFIPNLHVLTARQDSAQLHHDTLSMAAWLIAAGLRQDSVTLFAQSQVPAHSELMWILMNYVTMGELGRMTQFKDKSRSGSAEGELVGLFAYPVLMAADILLYDADEVPVGDDQSQHVELTRNIAERFNNRYGETFRLPRAVLPTSAARVMNLQHPEHKMSKSDSEHSGNILLSDSPEAIRQKIQRAVTDSGHEVRAASDKPAISNLLEIFAVTTDRSLAELEAAYAGKSYGAFKSDLADTLVEHLEPIRQRHDELMEDHAQLLTILDDGRAKASAIAEAKLQEVKQRLGLV